MKIPAGAFNRASDNAPNFAFNCTFCYALTPLQVVSTVPPVGGTFSPPAPGTYNYDVIFNQPIDQASVQDNDLTVSGNSGPSVTGHSFVERQHDCPVHAAYELRRDVDGDPWRRGDHR